MSATLQRFGSLRLFAQRKSFESKNDSTVKVTENVVVDVPVMPCRMPGKPPQDTSTMNSQEASENWTAFKRRMSEDNLQRSGDQDRSGIATVSSERMNVAIMTSSSKRNESNYGNDDSSDQNRDE